MHPHLWIDLRGHFRPKYPQVLAIAMFPGGAMNVEWPFVQILTMFLQDAPLDKLPFDSLSHLENESCASFRYPLSQPFPW